MIFLLLLTCYIISVGVSPYIHPEIQVQTHSLCFFPLICPSTKIRLKTLSSHLITICQGLIVGDGDGVEQSNLGDDARDCLLQLLWLMVVQLGHIIMWGSCLPSLLSLDQTVSTESASSLEAENFLQNFLMKR